MTALCPRLHWTYWPLAGKWYCTETRQLGFPLRGDRFLDADEWGVW